MLGFILKFCEVWEMEKSSKQAPYSYPPSLAQEVAGLVEGWRAEAAPNNKRQKKSLDPKAIDEYLMKAESTGMPALLVTYALLGCEWVFRSKVATEEDIEKVLYQMQSGFCKHAHPILTRFQAHILIKSLEQNLRKQMKGLRIPIILGFDAPGSEPFWSLFQLAGGKNPKRVVPKQIVKVKKGRLPLLGPIIAGVVTAALFETDQPKIARGMGLKLAELLLKREVQRQEFRKWEKILGTLKIGEKNIRDHLRDSAWAAYQQSFVAKSDKLTPELLLKKCRTSPEDVLFWFSRPEVLEQVYSAKWA
jgi:hypothetical protein